MCVFIYLLVLSFILLALCGDLINFINRDSLNYAAYPIKSITAAMDGGITLCMQRLKDGDNEIYIKRKAQETRDSF